MGAIKCLLCSTVLAMCAGASLAEDRLAQAQTEPAAAQAEIQKAPAALRLAPGKSGQKGETAVSAAAGPIADGTSKTILITESRADGAGGVIRVYDAAAIAKSQRAKLEVKLDDPAFRGGVRVAAGDVNGDGVADIITAAGPGGGPHVKVLDGSTGAALHEFNAFDAGFQGGVFVSAGDVNGDGVDDILAGTGPINGVLIGLLLPAVQKVRAAASSGAGGGPHVRVFDGASGQLLYDSASQ